jgi:tetratricopeptide (TPR) repeat protein
MMNKYLNKVTKSLSALALVASMVAPAVYSGQAFALTPEERQTRIDAKTKIPAPKVGKKVTKAFELYSQELPDEALTMLLEVNTSKTYDKAFLNRFIGNIYATMDGKTDEALKYLLMAYEPDVLNYKEQGEIIKILAQLYMMKKEFQKSIDMYEEWMSFTGEEDEKIYVRIASAYYELKQMDKILAPADKAIALAQEPNKVPYSLKLASYFERKMYKDTVKMGETIVKIFPEDKRNWVQLGMFYVMVEDFKRGLSTMEMAYKQGYLEKPNEFRTLAQMYSQNEVPIKAATIQEKYIKLGVIKRTEQNLKSLANYFLASKEMVKAAKYFGEAADLTDKASLYKRQGEMLFQAEKYGQAVVALKKALEKGVDRKGPVNITLMQSYFYQGKFKSAFAALKEADKYPKAKAQVRSWKQYIIDKAKHKGVTLKG